LFALSLVEVAGAVAQQKSLSLEKRAAIEKAVSSFMSANSVPGVAAAVVLEDSAPATSRLSSVWDRFPNRLPP
jgi:hypothetical protein